MKKACGSNSKLRSRIEALLESHKEAGGFFQKPAIGPAITLDDAPISEAPGTVIGRYKLLEKIGEGGMAVVYMAEQQEPIRRKVALKIIKLGMDTKSVIARFEAERYCFQSTRDLSNEAPASCQIHAKNHTPSETGSSMTAKTYADRLTIWRLAMISTRTESPTTE